MRLPLLILSLSVVLLSCKHEIDELPVNNNPVINNPNNPNNPNPPSGICFESDVLPLLVSNCAMSGCHSGSNPAEGINLSSYASIMNSGESNLIVPGNPNASDLVEVLTEDDSDKIMPRPPASPLSTDQINLIRQWITEGAQNTTNCGGCDTTQYTFAAHIRPIVQSSCTGCHSGSFPGGGVALVTFDQIQAMALNGRLLGAIDHQQGYSPMPKSAAQLPFCERTVIRKWVQAGAQNN